MSAIQNPVWIERFDEYSKYLATVCTPALERDGVGVTSYKDAAARPAASPHHVPCRQGASQDAWYWAPGGTPPSDAPPPGSP